MRFARLRTLWTISDKFVLSVLFIALVYVLLRLSPSAYAIAFGRMQVGHPGLYFSHPRDLRSDEWAMWTPYIQAAVNNHFGRFNMTSVYHEDLRNFNVLPLRDWGLPLKPEMWAFFALEPARAYSIFHASIMAAFVIGWYGFISILGFSRVMAALGSLLLFYTPYTQDWFTTTGPALSFFPFICWLFLSNLHPLLKLPLTAWLTAVWLIGNLYPPIDISIAFAGAVLILAFRPTALTRWRHLAATLFGAGIGVGFVWLYFHDVIAVMAATLYPGQRINGGGQVEFAQWLAQILPNFASVGEETFAAPNYLEANTSATYLLVFAMSFAGWDGLRKLFSDPSQRAARLALTVIGCAFVLISIWQLFPVPQQFGAPLLWNRAPARRFVFANGAILLCAALVILRAAPPALTGRRFLTAAGVVVMSYLLSKGLVSHHQFRRGAVDLIPLVPLAALWFWRDRVKGESGPAVAMSALASGIVMWGFYNPIQSSWPIFHRPVSPLATQLQRDAKSDPRGWVVYRSLSGAVFNGWGLPSVEHSLMRPQMAFFRRLYPTMTPDYFNLAFNRFASVRVGNVPVPLAVDGADIELPLQSLRPSLATSPGSPLRAGDYRGGQIDSISFDPATKVVTLTGWGYLSSQNGASRLYVQGPEIEKLLSVVYLPRPDAVSAGGDSRLANSGFVLRATTTPGATGKASVCLWADDPVFGRTWLNDAPAAPPCPTPAS